MILKFILITLSACYISSAWLYSPGTEKLREWWLNNTDKLKPLAYCQLCCSFWIALVLTIIIGIKEYVIFYAFSSAFISWLLGAFTNSHLWKKAYYEQRFYDK